jgi:hypothetical protein
MLLVTAVAALLATPEAADAAEPVLLPTYLAAGVPVHSGLEAPAMLMFGADGRTTLVGLQWSGWGEPAAVAQGMWKADVGPAGEPQYIEAPATLTASAIERCDGLPTYTHLTLSSPNPEAGIYPNDLTKLWSTCVPIAPSSGATLGQIGDDLRRWHLRPVPLYPSRLPRSFDGAIVTLDRFAGVDFDIEFAKPDGGCRRVDASDRCLELRRASAAALTAILRNPESRSIPHSMRIGRRRAWFVNEGGNAGGWELAWHEQGRTYIAWEWTPDARTARRTLIPLVASLRPLS